MYSISEVDAIKSGMIKYVPTNIFRTFKTYWKLKRVVKMREKHGFMSQSLTFEDDSNPVNLDDYADYMYSETKRQLKFLKEAGELK